jgi:TonB family protein
LEQEVKAITILPINIKTIMKNRHKKHRTIGRMAIILLGVFSFTGFAQIPKQPKYEPDIVDKPKKVVNENYKETPFGGIVEKMPVFPGGNDSLLNFIRKNLRLDPKTDYGHGIPGKVIVKFIVSKTGEVSNVQVVRSLCPPCDKEAVRVVKLLPKFTPGELNGKKVGVWYTLPVVFKL